MDLAKHWRQRAARYRLEGQRNTATGAVRFPPESVTGDVEAWEPFMFCGRGTVYSFSVVRQPPDGYESQTPYIVALVKLDEGPLISAQLTDCDAAEVQIDMPVEATTRRLRDLGAEGLILYGYKFRPRLS